MKREIINTLTSKNRLFFSCFRWQILVVSLYMGKKNGHWNNLCRLISVHAWAWRDPNGTLVIYLT